MYVVGVLFGDGEEGFVFGVFQSFEAERGAPFQPTVVQGAH